MPRQIQPTIINWQTYKHMMTRPTQSVSYRKCIIISFVTVIWTMLHQDGVNYNAEEGLLKNTAATVYQVCVCVCGFTKIRISATLPSILLTEHHESNTEYRHHCTLTQYASCLSGMSGIEIQQYKQCSDACLPACNHWQYELRALSERSSDNGVGIFIPYTEHTEIRQRVSFTWDMVIANIGGLMEFWIGAGLVSFFHMFLFVAGKVIRFCSNLTFFFKISSSIARKLGMRKWLQTNSLSLLLYRTNVLLAGKSDKEKETDFVP